MSKASRSGAWSKNLLFCGLLIASGTTASQGQSPPVPPPSLPPEITGEAPAPIEKPTTAPTAREAALEERIQHLEQMVQKMAAQLNQGAAPPSAAAPAPSALKTPNFPNATGPLAPGQGTPANPAPSVRFDMPSTSVNFPLTGKFGPGFEFKTADEEFVAQWHNLTQFDGRFYQQANQSPTHDTFAFPRQWWMLSGRITKPFEYFISFQNGFDAISMLDVFLNIHYDDRLQFKVGRYKTPFTYEFYALPIQGLVQPERSLFFNNFALNRSLGVQAWGRLFAKTAPLDYAVGMFNGARNSFVDLSDAKNVLAFVNWRPFAQDEGSLLENFNFGGSVQAGTQTNPPLPQTLRTIVPTAGNSVAGVPFLSFNSNVRESGPRAFWDLHAAWYYQHLSLIAEWQSGYQDYALANSLASHNRVGVDSFYVQAGYFITGETVSGRNVVKPLNDFDLRPGRFGLGAIELTTRFNSMNMTRNIFDAGLADPNLWTNNLYTADFGVNWSLNQFVLFRFDWEHAVFGNPVLYNTDSLQKTSDLFLFRFQLYF
ncbi:OprO/OprP family phosphate-selective porin [Tundrisphaera lichenicola]|uniref:OprO/OprP family phosphate-selective porin n=1 Tax=Tundrisphaera lichenicola TaxID=2029860 RepID=UPI003EC0C83E